MPRQKVIDGIYYDMTAEEEAADEAESDLYDQDLTSVRIQRNGMLSSSDWTRLDDATLGDHTVEEWTTYRQALRDYPSQSDRVSTLPAWPQDPPAAKVTRKMAAGDAAYDAAIASDPEDAAAAQAAYDTAYAATD
jgi:hypothetical protein